MALKMASFKEKPELTHSRQDLPSCNPVPFVSKDNPALIFRQFFEGVSSTYTYLLACPSTSEAILIDPVLETAERDFQFINEMGLKLKYAINTHLHADHITGTGKLKSMFEAEMEKSKNSSITVPETVISEATGAVADIKLKEGDKLQFGKRFITVIATPGHTNGCVCYVLDDKSRVFTGDTLLIRGCGRTDFQEGSNESLFKSVREKLFSNPGNTKMELGDDCLVFPAHDYKGRTCSSIGEEKRCNPRLKIGNTLEDFSGIMDKLGLAYPKQIDRALPANMECGVDFEKY
jgi:sulfur dioxygenase